MYRGSFFLGVGFLLDALSALDNLRAGLGGPACLCLLGFRRFCYSGGRSGLFVANLELDSSAGRYARCRRRGADRRGCDRRRGGHGGVQVQLELETRHLDGVECEGVNRNYFVGAVLALLA